MRSPIGRSFAVALFCSLALSAVARADDGIKEGSSKRQRVVAVQVLQPGASQSAPVAIEAAPAPASSPSDNCKALTRSLEGEQARRLTKALQMAGVAPTQAKAADGAVVDRFRASELSCASSGGQAYGDDLPRYSCNQGPPRALDGEAIASALIEALDAAGVNGDPSMQQTYYVASDVRCDLVLSSPPSFKCVLTAMWQDHCSH